MVNLDFFSLFLLLLTCLGACAKFLKMFDAYVVLNSMFSTPALTWKGVEVGLQAGSRRKSRRSKSYTKQPAAKVAKR